MEADPHNMLIFTDRSYWRRQRSGQSAFIVYANGVPINSDFHRCPAASSFDAEIEALLSALQWFSAHRIQIQRHLLTMKPFLRGPPLQSLRINLELIYLFSTSDVNLHSSYCPSHIGVQDNQRADQVAKSDGEPELPGPHVHRQHYTPEKKLEATRQWRAPAFPHTKDDNVSRSNAIAFPSSWLRENRPGPNGTIARDNA